MAFADATRTAPPMALAFSYLVPGGKSGFGKCQTMLTCTPIMHVELLIKRPCMHKKCLYFDASTHGGGDPAMHAANCNFHIISYAARSMGDDHTVSLTVDAEYKKENGWVKYGIYATDEQVNAVERFMRSQLGSEYSWWASFLNFTCCLCWPSGTFNEEVRLTAAGPPPLPTGKTWFCSELVVAALLYAGIIKNTFIEPPSTAPDGIYRYLAKLPDVAVPLSHDEFIPLRGPAAFSGMTNTIRDKRRGGGTIM